MVRVSKAEFERDDAAIQVVARQSKFTRDFCSILFVRQNIEKTYEKGEIGVARAAKGARGFILAHHLVRKPYTSVYYMGVDERARRKGVGDALVYWALTQSPHKRLELVCELRNEAAYAFYLALGFEKMGEGTVGKVPRPYHRLVLTA